METLLLHMEVQRDMASIKDSIEVRGKFQCEVIKDGEVIREYVIRNRVVQSGLNLIAGLLANTTSYRLGSIGVGSGTGIVTANDSDLTSGVWSNVTFTRNNNSVRGQAVFGESEANQLIGEFGVRDLSGGLFARTKATTSFTKEVGSQLRVTWSSTIDFYGKAS